MIRCQTTRSQIIFGTIKVIPTAQYYPLRFHCVQMLINLSNETQAYVPVLPFLTEVWRSLLFFEQLLESRNRRICKYLTLNLISQILESYDFDKKQKAVGLKPTPLICILRLSKSQLNDNNCKNSVFDTIYQLMLEYAANESNKMYFPELYIPCIIHVCKTNVNENELGYIMFLSNSENWFNILPFSSWKRSWKNAT